MPLDYDPSHRRAPTVSIDPAEQRRQAQSGDSSGDYLLYDRKTMEATIVSKHDLHAPSLDAAQAFRGLAQRLTVIHPAISTEEHIFGGMPHIKGVRLSVGDILAKLYVYGNIQEILESYSPHVSEEQIKEAIAYAQDFLETACDPDQISEADD
jgi:uncharacterized protein (DUF433 family)